MVLGWLAPKIRADTFLPEVLERVFDPRMRFTKGNIKIPPDSLVTRHLTALSTHAQCVQIQNSDTF